MLAFFFLRAVFFRAVFFHAVFFRANRRPKPADPRQVSWRASAWGLHIDRARSRKRRPGVEPARRSARRQYRDMWQDRAMTTPYDVSYAMQRARGMTIHHDRDVRIVDARGAKA
jgi:hypothetical protein